MISYIIFSVKESYYIWEKLEEHNHVIEIDICLSLANINQWWICKLPSYLVPYNNWLFSSYILKHMIAYIRCTKWVASIAYAVDLILSYFIDKYDSIIWL